jgi:hypothetical protein
MHAGSHARSRDQHAWIGMMEGRFRSSNPCLVPCQCNDVTWCKQLARMESRFSSNLNAFCRLDSAWCIGLCIVCVHHDVNACAYMHVQHARMSSFKLDTFAGGCTRQYSVPVFHTGWSDCTFWQQLYPKSPSSALSLPLACARLWWTSNLLSSKFHSSS